MLNEPLFGVAHQQPELSGEAAVTYPEHTYIYMTVKYNNINILSSQINFDVQVNIESFDWRRILKSLQK
jgi:hypothetical protein